jgi:hypothetical protein
MSASAVICPGDQTALKTCLPRLAGVTDDRRLHRESSVTTCLAPEPRRGQADRWFARLGSSLVPRGATPLPAIVQTMRAQ